MSIHEQIRGALASRPAQLQRPAEPVRWAAVALVLAPGGEDGLDALLIRRAQREGDPWSGHVALPGGRQEPDDPDLFTTARRETREEIGLTLADADCLGQLDDLHPTRGLRPPVVVRPYVFGLRERPRLRLNWEVAGELWTPLERLRGERVSSRIVVAGREREVPSIPLGEDLLWGMTLRILDGFLERVG
jgi:8-oxo-dGTP pyrophosphatase MutT (NUDIX family)